MTLVQWESLSFDFLSVMGGTVIRSVVLAALCGVAAWLLRSRTAAVRHLLWKGLLWALLLLPVLLLLVPPLEGTSGALSLVEVAVLPGAPAAHVSTSQKPQPGRLAKAGLYERTRLRWLPALAVLNLGVVLLLMARLVAGMRRLDRMAARGETIADENFRELAHELWLHTETGCEPRIAVSAEIAVPVAFGISRPQILLPRDWVEWDGPTLRAVLMHELAHGKRQDAATAFVASLATCLFWFHPLSWFLQRHLSALAEEACDEQVLSTVAEPDEYAAVLIHFARVVKAQGGRTPAAASAVVRSSQLKTRIERLFLAKGNAQRGRRLLSGCIIALFLPALYLAAASRFEQPPQTADSTVVTSSGHYWQLANTLTAEDEARLTAELASHPDDLDARSQLLVYYARHNQAEEIVGQLLWFIEHHPESPLISSVQMMVPHSLAFAADVERLSAAWKNAVAQHPQSAPVLLNAAEYLTRSDPKYALQLFAKIKQLDPSKAGVCETWTVRIYAAAEVEHITANPNFFGVYMTPDIATELDSQLESSNDPSLLSRVGSLVVSGTAPGNSTHSYFVQRGFELIRSAIALDPNNPAWKEALASAEAEPTRRQSAKRLSAGERNLVRIGEGVADANLVTRVDPVYPPTALAARIQGTVEFAIVVGKDGHIQNFELVRGHPLLVQAAATSLQQRIYKPTLLNGQPIAVLTEASVVFRLPQ